MVAGVYTREDNKMTMLSRNILCVMLISMLVVIAICESRDSSESKDTREERDGREKDSVDTDMWLCRGKRRGQLCDDGEGRCVWARKARRMVCVEMDGKRGEEKESNDD